MQLNRQDCMLRQDRAIFEEKPQTAGPFDPSYLLWSDANLRRDGLK
jgi:hypothetical protein